MANERRWGFGDLYMYGPLCLIDETYRLGLWLGLRAPLLFPLLYPINIYGSRRHLTHFVRPSMHGRSTRA